MDDEQILLQFLPANVWAEVGDRVMRKRNGDIDVQNFQDMSNSSMFFRDILRPRRTLALFEPAFNIAVPRLQTYAEEKITDKASKSEEDLDNERQAKGKEIVSSTILNSRGVCKVWSLAMDRIIFDLTNYQVMGEGWVERFRGLEKAGLYFVVEMCNLKKLVSHFEATHNDKALVDRSPFVCRRAFIVLYRFGILDETRDPRFPAEVLKVLKLYGRHLRSLRFHVVDNFASAEECYGIMRQMLIHVPNLVELDIKCDSIPAREKEEWEAVEVDREENQLPRFPHMVQLVAKLPEVVLNHFVGKNNHVLRITALET